ncbi:MAG: ABC transporter permease [Anaerolineales bacterium]|nr:ABC transporter permease [Anaerolineales bacterium]
MKTADQISIGLIFKVLQSVQNFALLVWKVISSFFSRPRYIADTYMQMDIIGVSSLPIVLLTGFFTGAVLALQSSLSLKAFGAVNLTGQLVALTLVRELGPVLIALMVAGRIGSGISSQLGSMVVTEQIDAMRALGTDPVRKLVTPRVIATTTMLPLLTVAGDLFGMIGGWIVSLNALKLNTSLYWSEALRSLTYVDALEGLVKPFVFGFIIGMVGCYTGLNTRGGTHGVGKSTTSSVVTASILIIVADFFISKVILEFR